MKISGELRSRIGANLPPLGGRMRRAQIAAPAFEWTKFFAAILAGAALVLLVAVTIDEPIIAWTRTLPDGVRDFFATLTRLGRSDWLLIPTGLLAIAVALGNWRSVSRPVAAAWWEIGTFAAVLFAVVAAAGLTTDVLKPIFGRLRPEYAGDSAFIFDPFTLAGSRYYSFPSGHATVMGAVAVFAAFAPGILTIPILIVAATVAISRVVIDVHFPSDVVGGALIGVGVGYLILRLMAASGIAFVVRANGSVGRRLGVVRRLRRRKAGFRRLLTGLGQAWSRPATRSP